jgi:ubiquinol-cytochrome c reductase cytochrome c1 subunit
MSRILIIVAGLLLPSLGWGAGGGHTFPNDKVVIDWDDKAAMQRGARTFVNYCLSCHSAAYSRFNRVGEDLGIPDDLVRENLIFTTDVNGDKTKVGELMKTTMTPVYAEQAFGTVPPDLSLIARSRGVDWLYDAACVGRTARTATAQVQVRDGLSRQRERNYCRFRNY